MKTTDYCPRAAPFDAHLRGRRDLVGVEVGVDAGAHAEALLRYCDIRQLYLVDLWPKDYHFGYCEGRLREFAPRVTFVRRASGEAWKQFEVEQVDFVYCDEARDAVTVMANLQRWWPIVKPGGLLGYRGYATGYDVATACDAFLIKAHGIRTIIERGEEIILCK